MAIVKVTRAEQGSSPRWGCGCQAFRHAFGNFPKDLPDLAIRSRQVTVEKVAVEGGRIVFETVTAGNGHRYVVVLDPNGTPQTGWCKHIEACARILIQPVDLGR